MTAARIVRVAGRGDGVTADGRHVPLAAPGDLIGADGAIQPGPHHATPPCRHFPRCGGCQLQHLDDASYAAFLIDRIAGALAAQGVPPPEIRPPYLSPPRTRRRAALRAERAGQRIALGFSEAGSHRIVDLAECHVLHPELFALLAPLRGLLARLLPPRRVAEIRLALADQGVDLVLEGVAVEGLTAVEAIARFAGEQRLARLSLDEGFGPQPRWEPEPVTVTLGGVRVTLPPGGFLQATADGEAALVAAVREALGEETALCDLFAGLGTFALPLSTRAKVHAVEGARDAILALGGAATRAGRPVTVEHRDLFRRPMTTAELDRFGGIVLDPPRAGAKEQAPALAAAGAARIAYVSCNPATFARDAKTLIEGGWRIDWVQPIGQFRWSTQVELVAAFARS